MSRVVRRIASLVFLLSLFVPLLLAAVQIEDWLSAGGYTVAVLLIVLLIADELEDWE